MPYEWDKSRPVGSQPISDLDNAIRDTRAGVEDFLDDEHTIDVSNPAAVTCKHALGSARAGYDTEANKPTTGVGIETGRLFVASDSKKLFVGNGSSVDPITVDSIPNALTISPPNVHGVQNALILQDRGSGASEGAQIAFRVADHPGIDIATIGLVTEADGGSLILKTNASDTGSPTERMKIAANGTVTIGGNYVWAGAATEQSLAANGYQKFPSGLIIQWGTIHFSNGGAYEVTLPRAFPTAHVAGFVTPVNYAGKTPLYYNKTLSGMSLWVELGGDYHYLAIGY